MFQKSVWGTAISIKAKVSSAGTTSRLSKHWSNSKGSN